jgi:hypothetical protein
VDFADLYAQTITYGLFAARTRAQNGFNRRSAFDSIPHTIGVLRDLFRFISLGDLPESLAWCVDDIAEVLVGKGKKDGLRYDPAEQRVYINAAQHFTPVPEAVWAYRIGSYQVCEKRLKDRRERRLELDDIRTYCRIVTALKLTIGMINLINIMIMPF